jgi:penicillin-binding protein 2
MERPQIVQTRILRGLILVLFAVIVTDLFYLQVTRHEHYQGQSLQNRQIRTRVKAPRGRILDRSGEILADNIYIADITLPRSSLSIAGPDSTLEKIVTWLNLDRDRVYERLMNQLESGWSRLLVIPNADMSQIGVIEERAAELPGARVVARSRRRYIYGSLFTHLIGYVGEVRRDELDTESELPFYTPGDVIGRQGIESHFESQLRGQPGAVLQEVNAAGRVVGHRVVELVPVISGNDVQLTLSLALQDSLTAALGDRPGCAVAMSLPSGEVLAAVSAPVYDPNMFTTGISNRDWDRLLNDPAHPFLNRVVQAAYPPASPYKIVTSLSALENGVVDYHSHFDPCYGSYRFGNRDFGCWKRSGHGETDHAEALIHSCDVFYYQLGQQLTLEQIRETALKLGLGKSTGSPLGGEISGNVPDSDWYDERYGPRRWTRGVLLNNAIGQGELLVTPLQMAVMTGRVATGLADLNAHFVLDPDAPPVTTRPLDLEPSHLSWVRQTMARVVDTGTGTRARLEAIEVAGKTGTAENPHGEDHAWFICFAPASKPEVAMVVILENAGHGGVVAAPVAARWLSAFFGESRMASPRSGEVQH